MDLHWCCRQQHQPFGAVLQSLHQAEKRIRSTLLRTSRGPATGMVGFVEHHQIPGFGFLQKPSRPVAPAHQVA